MKVTEIFEARRNPHLNPKSDFVAEFYYLYHKYRDDLYLSFTKINKLGVNPKSKFDTPIGIYTYPANYVKKILEQYDSYNVKKLPFAGDRPYVQFLQSKGNGLDLQEYSKHDLVRDLNKLFEYVYNDKLGEIDIDEIIQSDAFEEETKFITHGYSSVLWTIIYFYANPHISSDTVEMIEDFFSESGTVVIHPKEFTKKPSINWNTILSKIMGYDYVADNGYGIIHHNERYQAVFLNNRGYTHIGSYELGKEGADKTSAKYNLKIQDILTEVIKKLRKDFSFVNENTKIPEPYLGSINYVTIKDSVKEFYKDNDSPHIKDIIEYFTKLLMAYDFAEEDFDKNEQVYKSYNVRFSHVFILFKHRITVFVSNELHGSYDDLVETLKQNKQRIINQAHNAMETVNKMSSGELK